MCLIVNGKVNLKVVKVLGRLTTVKTVKNFFQCSFYNL